MLEELREAPKKVDYFKVLYSRMHRRITGHPVSLGPSNLHLLDGVTFAFIAMDVAAPTSWPSLRNSNRWAHPLSTWEWD